VVLFAIAWFVRRASAGPDATVLVLELVAAGLLIAGGWMGGTLVNRNQIGVDHRYASAGKWQERQIEARPGTSVLVARSGDLEVDQMKLLRVGGRRIVLARTEQGYVAFDDRCTHRGGALSGGTMICGTVQCPWHGSQFDVRTGSVKAGPAKDGITTYPVEETQGEVRLRL
jgi:nitrite reductase/ring-hydroxylating ferredoxin subunit